MSTGHVLTMNVLLFCESIPTEIVPRVCKGSELRSPLGATVPHTNCWEVWDLASIVHPYDGN
jgi:hypothetical protein